METEYTLYSRERMYLAQLFPDGPAHPESINDDARTLTFSEEADLKAGYNAVLQEHSTILLLGSLDVAAQSDRLVTKHKELVDLALSMSASSSYESASETAARASELAAAHEAVVAARTSLLGEVRLDLGIVD